MSNPRDSLHRSALVVASRLGEHRIVTSEMVLIEVLNSAADEGVHSRRGVAGLVQGIIDNDRIELVPQSSQLFREAFAVYRDRPD